MQSRRRLLEGAAVAALGLAGCPLGGGDGDDEDTPDDETFVDPCASLQLLADASDADGLGTDTTNTENFEHPDGSTDEARIVRHGTTDDVAAVYAPGGELVDATVEFHWHEDVGGDARLEESTDGADRGPTPRPNARSTAASTTPGATRSCRRRSPTAWTAVGWCSPAATRTGAAR